jgi:lysophospholipase L1-like esterase
MKVLAALDERCAPRLVIVSGLPPVSHFPALPQPLRWVLGLKARALDRVVRELSADLPHVLYVPLALTPGDRSMMATDGYHPSAKGCVAWAQLLANAHAACLLQDAAHVA